MVVEDSKIRVIPRVAMIFRQCLLKYNRQLMQTILHGRLNIADIVNAQVISLEDAAMRYESFDQGTAKKFVLDPHGLVGKAVCFNLAWKSMGGRPNVRLFW